MSIKNPQLQASATAIPESFAKLVSDRGYVNGRATLKFNSSGRVELMIAGDVPSEYVPHSLASDRLVVHAFYGDTIDDVTRYHKIPELFPDPAEQRRIKLQQKMANLLDELRAFDPSLNVNPLTEISKKLASNAIVAKPAAE